MGLDVVCISLFLFLCRLFFSFFSVYNPTDTERVIFLDLVTSMFVVCFRRSLDCQGEEQEAGGGNGGRFPGHPEHMNWCTRRKNSKPSLTNLIKPLLKCQDTKCNIYINFYFICTFYKLVEIPSKLQDKTIDAFFQGVPMF